MSAILRQIEKAAAEVASWSPEKRARIVPRQLEPERRRPHPLDFLDVWYDSHAWNGG